MAGTASCCRSEPAEKSKATLGRRIVTKHRIYTTSFASVYPHYVAKAEKKGRTKAEVDEIIAWLTGYGPEALEAELEAGTDFETLLRQGAADEPRAGARSRAWSAASGSRRSRSR